jgi:hypothetical protein
MKDKDLEKLINGGRSVYESALAVLFCSLGASIAIIIAILISNLK